MYGGPTLPNWAQSRAIRVFWEADPSRSALWPALLLALLATLAEWASQNLAPGPMDPFQVLSDSEIADETTAITERFAREIRQTFSLGKK